METRQRRSFTDDYKRQAVDLVVSSGRSIGAMAIGPKLPRPSSTLPTEILATQNQQPMN
jgi:hypothetical protein